MLEQGGSHHVSEVFEREKDVSKSRISEEQLREISLDSVMWMLALLLWIELPPLFPISILKIIEDQTRHILTSDQTTPTITSTGLTPSPTYVMNHDT